MNFESFQSIEDFVEQLRSHPLLQDVQFLPQSPSSSQDINEWEQRNSPFQLPADFKSFYLTRNGFSLSYLIKKGPTTIPLGKASLLPLKKISRIRSLDFNDRSGLDLTTPPSLPHAKSLTRSVLSAAAAFVISNDISHLGGRLTMFYKEGTIENPEYWFQDYSCQWFFVCSSFTSLLRLCFIHLCLPRWPCIFTDILPDPNVLNWYRLLVPKRLSLDLESLESKKARKRDGSPVDSLQLSAVKPSLTTPKLDTSRLQSLLIDSVERKQLSNQSLKKKVLL
ncbi:hypothetical protein RCL1_006248 [Eukaryota sp. TZLM3-RCL]